MLYGGISKQEFEVFPKNLVQPQLVRIVENNNTTQSAATALQTEIVQLKNICVCRKIIQRLPYQIFRGQNEKDHEENIVWQIDNVGLGM